MRYKNKLMNFPIGDDYKKEMEDIKKFRVKPKKVTPKKQPKESIKKFMHRRNTKKVN